jgi:YbbR domain-containing protein
MHSAFKNFIRFNLFKDLALKSIAFVLAVIIWVLVVGEQKSEVRLTVPLELRNLPPTDLEIIKSPREVEVTIRGFSSSVKRLTSSDFDVYIDLSNVVKGSNTFTISPEDIAGPVGSTVTQVSPSSVEVFLDATIVKVLPVEAVVRGKPSDGYVLGAVTSVPKSVRVTGAQSLLKNVTKVETEAIVLNNSVERFSRKVKIKLPEVANAPLRLNKEDEVVEVTAEIVPEMISRFFENIPLLVDGEEDRKVSIVPDSVTALINGPKLRLQELKPEDIPAMIETRSLPEGQSTVQVKFTLPELVSVKVYYPKTIITNISPNPQP